MKNLVNMFKVLIVIFFAGGFIYAQCPTPEKIVKSTSKRDTYRPSTQSKSGALKPGGTYEMSFVARSGYDYKISCGAEDKNVNVVGFEIYEMITRRDDKGNYKRVKNTISVSDGIEAIEFATDKSRKMMIKVTLEALESDKPQCMAVLIEHKKSVKLGLE